VVGSLWDELLETAGFDCAGSESSADCVIALDISLATGSELCRARAANTPIPEAAIVANETGSPSPHGFSGITWCSEEFGRSLRQQRLNNVPRSDTRSLSLPAKRKPVPSILSAFRDALL
jgi:hypothetical protein